MNLTFTLETNLESNTETLEDYDDNEIEMFNNLKGISSLPIDKTLDEDSVLKYLITRENVNCKKYGKLRRLYECGFCRKQHHEISCIKGHMIRNHAKSSNIPCHICQKVFASRLVLARHLKKCLKKFDGQ